MFLCLICILFLHVLRRKFTFFKYPLLRMTIKLQGDTYSSYLITCYSLTLVVPPVVIEISIGLFVL